VCEEVPGVGVSSGLHGNGLDEDPHEDEIDLALVEEDLLGMEVSPAPPVSHFTFTSPAL